MRKRGNILVFLLLAAVGLAAAAGWAVFGIGRGAAPRPAPVRVFPGLADRVDDLAWVRVSRGPAKVDFAYVAGQWVVIEKGNYPAARGSIDRLLLGLANLTLPDPTSPPAELPPAELPPAGDLADPATGKATLIELRARTGSTVAELLVADAPGRGPEGGGAAVYFRKPGDERAALAWGSLAVPGDALGWLDRDIVDIPQPRIASVRLTGGDGAALALRRDGPVAKFALANLPDGARVRPDARLSDPAAALAGLVLDDVRPVAEIDFPENGVATAEFATFDGLEIRVRLVEHEGADWIAVAAAAGGAEATAESEAINRRVARWAYAIPPERARVLRTRLGDLIEPAKGVANAR